MKRISTVAALLVLLVLGAACQTIRPTGTPSGNTPVVFVHGWNGDETLWNTAVEEFHAAGYSTGDITVVYYDSSRPAAEAAATLAAEVDHLRDYTGQDKVDIVSHSYGSMVTRYCIELGGCAGKVEHWMSLAGADNGTAIAALCAFFQPSCADMAGQTSTIAQLQAAWPQITAQGVQVEVQWTANDGVIIPATNSQNPAPATNVEVDSTLTHNDLPSDPDVLAETIDFFD
jgi:triacylglycerol esterase/lipase EstA (alpha/beta hydrolase family)